MGENITNATEDQAINLVNLLDQKGCGQYYNRQEFQEAQLKLLKEFLMTKRIEGCREATIRDYHDKVLNLIQWAEKDLTEFTRKDIRNYLGGYQENHSVKDTTVDQIRIVLSTFFNFLEEEEYIIRNPVRGIKKIKCEEIIKLPFTDEELELIRRYAGCDRDLAIVDMLYSTGMRVGELVSLNIKDVNFHEREALIKGKGGKQRFVYFNARAKIEVLNYLSNRIDDDPALFVHKKTPYKRLNKSGVRHILHQIEKTSGVTDIHPHRFRRTLATNLLNKGMTLEQVQTILGHKSIETTLIYTRVNQEEAKVAHQKYTF